MKVQLVIVDNKPIGYNLVPENPDEQNTLKAIQSLHFLADDKRKRISYDGISTDNQGNPDCMYFIQHKYAALPPESEVKQLILKISGKYIPEVKPRNADNMKFYLKINGTHSYTADKQVKRIGEKDAGFMQFPSASCAALHANRIKQSGFDVQKYEIVPADQPLEIQSALMFHPDGKTYFTTGAYIQRISYVNRQGQTVFGWIVTSFESDTFCDGNYVEVSDYGTFLEALTPPADDEERKTEYIIQSLQSFGLKRIELGLYKTMLEAGNSTLYVRKLDSISSAGQMTQIESTLDEFLLGCPHFSRTAREILVDTFGRDRPDIFLTSENVLVIGSCRANTWSVTEHPHQYIPPAREEKEEARQNDLPPKERIQRMLLNYGVTELDLEEYYKTGYGYIATVYTEMVEYSHGDTEEYENLEDDILEDLVLAVGQQIVANEKAFRKSQS